MKVKEWLNEALEQAKKSKRTYFTITLEVDEELNVIDGNIIEGIK